MRQADAGHLSTGELLQALDDELTGAETLALESHLAVCEECRGRIHELGVLSVRLESWSAGLPVPEASTDRILLREKLAARDVLTVTSSDGLSGGTRQNRQRRVVGSPRLWHWAASAAVAAAVVVAAMLSPALRSLQHAELNGIPAGAVSQTFEVAGETFVALPYSNVDLPLNAPHIVQMEVPVTSLAEAGIVFEPVSSEQANPDRAVLADVLLGTDGEPLGVHVLAGE